MQYIFDKNKYTFYAYLRKSTKKDTQEASIFRQNETIKYFIDTYTNIDFDKEVIKFEEIWSAFKLTKKVNPKDGEIITEFQTRKEFKSLTEAIFLNRKNEWKRAILFTYDASRLTRNREDWDKIKTYLWIRRSIKDLKNRELEEVYFISNNDVWNINTDEDIIDNEIQRNKDYSNRLSKQNFSRFKQDLERWIIPPDYALEYNTPFDYDYKTWTYKAKKEEIKYFNKGLEKYEKWKLTQKELFEYFKNHRILDIKHNWIKRYFSRAIFQGEYLDKRTGKIIPLRYDTIDWKNPIKQHLLEFVRQKKKYKASSLKKDFISSILKTECWKTASFCIPWKNQWKKAIYYNFNTKPKMSIAFNSKLTNKKWFVQYVDDFELLPKLLFIYAKISICNILEKEIEHKEELKEEVKCLENKENKNKFEKEYLENIKWYIINYNNKIYKNNNKLKLSYSKDFFKNNLENIKCMYSSEKVIKEVINQFEKLENNEFKEYILYMTNWLKVKIDKDKSNIYNTLYNFFKTELDREEEQEDFETRKNNIDLQIKELKEKTQEDLNFYKEVKDSKNYILTQNNLEVELEKLEEIKNNLQNEVIDFWDFKDFIETLEKIFNFLLNLDLKEVWTLTFSELLNKNIITKSEFEAILQNTIIEPILYPNYDLKIKLFNIFEELLNTNWCRGAGLNHRHKDFQSSALPLSYPGLIKFTKRTNF